MNTLPLIVARDIEPQRTFEGIGTPIDLALFLSRILAVDSRSVERLNEVYVGSTEPTGEDRKPIWINTSFLYSIALLIGNQYRHIYPYPVNTPFIWTKGESELPSFAVKLSSSELIDYSLTAPVDPTYFYVIILV
jgi:hypothetical protein